MDEKVGNLLSVKEGLILHGCNAQGVMGSGVAKAIRDTYPQAYADYRAKYEAQGNRLGLGQIVWTRISMNPKLAIGNAVTQEFYGRDPKVRYVDYEAVRTVFNKAGILARREGLSVHYPQIGAGLGNGDWGVISAIIHEELAGVPHTLWLLEAPAAKPLPRRTPSP
jgi:O-acetyl-ADP-ribose deacetylase (regulator of RNase III)